MNSPEELRSHLRRSWAMLGSGDRDETVTTYDVSPTRNGPTRIHVSAPGHRHLLVPGEYRGAPLDGVSLGVGPRTLTFGGAEGSYLDVACREPGLFDVFDELILLVVAGAQDAEDPVEAAAVVIADWRDLLRSGPATRLSHEREMGLFAELSVLSKIVGDGSFNPGWWRGPLREPKDLVMPTYWVEVKGVAVDADFALIHGLDQLGDEEGLDGYLAVLAVDASDRGKPVEELVHRLEARATDADLFVERLRVAGWSVASSSGRRWQVESWHLIPARSCPRLVTGSLVDPVPVGVEEVRYSLDLAVARSFALRDPENLLRSLGQSL